MNSLTDILPSSIKHFLITAEPYVYFRKGSTVKGQVTFFYRQEKLYGIGCYHVLCANELKYKIYKLSYPDASASPIQLIQKKLNGEQHPIGRVVYGELNSRHDIALAEIHSPPVNLILIELPGQNEGELYFIKRGTPVSAPVLEKDITCLVRLNGQININFKGLIKTWKTSAKGDSGALVWDNAGNVAGMVEGDNAKYTYILQINNFTIA